MFQTKKRKMVVLTQGHTNPVTAKTAASVIRYCSSEVLAILDNTEVGKTSQDLLGAGGEIPIVGSLAEVPDAETLLIGIAPPGGKMPLEWRPILIEAIKRKMQIVSGLHQFLCEDAEWVTLAKQHGATLVDVRKNEEMTVAERRGIDESCCRILTVGNDCSIGKMVVSIEVAKGLAESKHDVAFLATGQTGIMIAGAGKPIDCVKADFISGAAEQLVLENQTHEYLIAEGQGSIAHPSFSGVTLGLLHGIAPDGLILVYEAGRENMKGLEHVPLKPLSQLIATYESVGSLVHPCKVIGIGVNTRNLNDDEARKECDRVSKELGLPATDVLRFGAQPLVDAVIALQKEKQQS